MTLDPLLLYLLNREAGLERTNPVHVVGMLVEQLTPRFSQDPRRTVRRFSDLVALLSRDGLRLPGFFLARLRECGCLDGDFPGAPPPRVVGLAKDLNAPLGLVVPLHLEHVEPPGDLDSSFPFDAGDMHDGFAALVRTLRIPAPAVLPERLSFQGINPRGKKIGGDSMQVAALLAALDALTGHQHPLLQGACATVEPAPEDRLAPVGWIRLKLEAFCREYQEGELLVCFPGSVEARLRERFRTVWEVATFRDLADKLQGTPLLGPLLAQVPVSRTEWEFVQDRIRRLVEKDHRYQEAIELGRRLLACSPKKPLPPAHGDGVEHLMAAAHRHLGQSAQAEQTARRVYDKIRRRGEFTCDDEQADAAVEYVASFYDEHRFHAMVQELKPWLEHMENDPGRFRPLTRVKVFNTAARAQLILGEPGWEALFRRSLALQQLLDPANTVRTMSYLIYGLLRHGRPDQAARELETLGPLDLQENLYSRWWLKYCRALAATPAQDPTDATELERQIPEPGKPNYLCGFYQYAVARHPRCREPVRRLRLASEFFRADAKGHPGNILHLFADCLELCAAVADHDRSAWLRAANAVRRFLDDPEAATLRAYYAAALARLMDEPDPGVVEHFLGLVPYF